MAEIQLTTLGCTKPYNQWYLPYQTGARRISEPSTVPCPCIWQLQLAFPCFKWWGRSPAIGVVKPIAGSQRSTQPTHCGCQTARHLNRLIERKTNNTLPQSLTASFPLKNDAPASFCGKILFFFGGAKNFAGFWISKSSKVWISELLTIRSVITIAPGNAFHHSALLFHQKNWCLEWNTHPKKLTWNLKKKGPLEKENTSPNHQIFGVPAVSFLRGPPCIL